MSTRKLKFALNELRSSVLNQVQHIKKEVPQFDLYKTHFDALLELPFVKQLIKDNKKLKRDNCTLEKQLLSVLLEKKKPQKKRQPLYANKREPLYANKREPIDEVEFVDPPIKQENIVYEILEDDLSAADMNEVEEQEVDEQEVEEQEVEEQEFEEQEVEEQEVEEQEVEEQEVEVEVDEEQEQEEVEEEEEEEEEVEEEEEEEVEEEEESGEVYEVKIKSKTYYVMNETDSIIYDVDENGDISLEVGIYKNGKPTFHKK